MSSLLLCTLLILTTLATAFLSGLIGMAGGIILMGVLLLLLPVSQAMILHGFVQLISNGWRAWLWRKFIKWPIALKSFFGAAIALLLMIYLNFVPDKFLVYLALGFLPFIQYLLPQNLKLDITKGFQALACGFVVTLTQLISGVSGGMLDQFYAYSPLDRREQVATKATCQIIGHLTKLIYFGGIVSSVQELSHLPLILFPLLMASAMAGNSLAAKPLERLTNKDFRLWSNRVLMILGIYYLGMAVVTFVY